MVMQDQARRLAEPLRWGRREKTVVAVLLTCVALAVAALVVYGVTGGKTARKDCIKVTFPSTLGGGSLKGCGHQAQRICANGAQFKPLQPDLRAACARAGFVFKD